MHTIYLSSLFRRLVLLGLVVLHSRLDGIFRQHAAMQLDRRQFQVRGNVGILDLQGVLDRTTLDPFRRDGRTGNGRSASKGFEFRFRNNTIVIYLDLEFHHIAAGGSSDEALLWKRKMGGKLSPES